MTESVRPGLRVRPNAWGIVRGKVGLAGLIPAFALVAGCTGVTVGTSLPDTTTPANTSTVPPTSTTIVVSPTTTSPPGAATLPFSVELGEGGITYEVPGDPPSGPSSFAVMSNGSVVIADTMAVRRGDPRLLLFGVGGHLTDTWSLATHEVASIVDIATDGERVAVLDVYAAMERYRVLLLGPDGAVETIHQIPPGLHLENGLSGIVWDDLGILVEMEGGSWYARVADSDDWDRTESLLVGGTEITITPQSGRVTQVQAGSTAFEVTRSADLGGVSLIGLGPDGAIVLVVDEVELGDEGLVVTRRIQRYTPEGVFDGEVIVDAGEQFVEISRTLEIAGDGSVVYLVTLEDRVEVRILDW